MSQPLNGCAGQEAVAVERQGSPSTRPRLSKPGTGAVDPRTVPCSLLGEKTIRARRTMGPGSGEQLVSAEKWLKAREKEPQLPTRECVGWCKRH
jgi:hypothetical protein